MNKSFSWKLILNHTNTIGSRLLFTNLEGGHLIDITMNPIVASQTIDEVLKRNWGKNDLIDYLDQMSGNVIENDCQT